MKSIKKFFLCLVMTIFLCSCSNSIPETTASNTYISDYSKDENNTVDTSDVQSEKKNVEITYINDCNKYENDTQKDHMVSSYKLPYWEQLSLLVEKRLLVDGICISSGIAFIIISAGLIIIQIKRKKGETDYCEE